MKGDIFEVGVSGDYHLILIFGYRGFNQMGASWMRFIDTFQQFQNIRDPFESDTILELNGKLIQFVAAQENHGMNDETLQQEFINAFEYMNKKQLKSIITNGIMNTNHSTNTSENIQNNDSRVSFIKKICSKYSSKFDITLISLNDVYVNNQL